MYNSDELKHKYCSEKRSTHCDWLNKEYIKNLFISMQHLFLIYARRSMLHAPCSTALQIFYFFFSSCQYIIRRLTHLSLKNSKPIDSLDLPSLPTSTLGSRLHTVTPTIKCYFFVLINNFNAK